MTVEGSKKLHRHHGKSPRVACACGEGQESDAQGTHTFSFAKKALTTPQKTLCQETYKLGSLQSQRSAIFLSNNLITEETFHASMIRVSGPSYIAAFSSFAPRGLSRRILIFFMRCVGRTTREEEDPQGPCEEEDNLHPSLRQRHHDRWEEEGQSRSLHLSLCRCWYWGLCICNEFHLTHNAGGGKVGVLKIRTGSERGSGPGSGSREQTNRAIKEQAHSWC